MLFFFYVSSKKSQFFLFPVLSFLLAREPEVKEVWAGEIWKDIDDDKYNVEEKIFL